MKVATKPEITTWKYFYMTISGYIIAGADCKQIGAAVGLDVHAFRSFHPEAEYIGSCYDCSMGVWAEMPPGTSPPKKVFCPTCRVAVDKRIKLENEAKVKAAAEEDRKKKAEVAKEKKKKTAEMVAAEKKKKGGAK